VMELMRDVKPDAKVAVRVLRDGKPHDYTVTVRGGPMFMAGDDMGNFGFGPMPPMPPMPPPMMRGPLADMELVTLTPQLGRYFGADKGVLVVRAPHDGALKLQDGDVILAIDGRQPTSGSHATRILASYQPGEKVALRVIRDRKTLELQATLPERSVRETHAHADTQPRVIAIAPLGDET